MIQTELRRASSFQKFLGRIRTHIDRHPRLAGDGVDGGAATDGADRKSGFRIARPPDIGDLCDGAAHRVDRARLAEIIEAVAARAFEGDLITPAAAGLIDNPVNAHLVDRDEAVDVRVVAEQRLDAAQVAEPFLADVADEHDVADGRKFRAVQAPRSSGEQHGKAAAVVTDARRVQDAVLLLDRHIGSGREHRVEVRRDD